jgi:hypothetical protein
MAGASPAMTESNSCASFAGHAHRGLLAHCAGIRAQDAAPEVLLGCSRLDARFSEFALTKAIVVALTMSGST